jgi:hypothetical protein
MRSEKEAGATVGIGIGIISELVGGMVANGKGGAAVFGGIITLVGVVFLVGGCMNYAVLKGYSKWLGLLGILSCVGLIVLILLPDHHRKSR